MVGTRYKAQYGRFAFPAALILLALLVFGIVNSVLGSNIMPVSPLRRDTFGQALAKWNSKSIQAYEIVIQTPGSEAGQIPDEWTLIVRDAGKSVDVVKGTSSGVSGNSPAQTNTPLGSLTLEAIFRYLDGVLAHTNTHDVGTSSYDYDVYYDPVFGYPARVVASDPLSDYPSDTGWWVRVISFRALPPPK
jgi:hypothetical protein